MHESGGHFEMILPAPVMDITEVFMDIKTMQKDNLNDNTVEVKEQKEDEEIKGLKFISKKLKILLQKNKKVDYNDASRILINNFAHEERDSRNIKRRVYDAINVLVATQVVKKQDNKIELAIKHHNIFCAEKSSRIGNEDAEVEKRVIEKRALLEKLRAKNQILKCVHDSAKSSKKQGGQAFFMQYAGTVKNVEINRTKKKVNISMKNEKMEGKPMKIKEFLQGLDAYF